MWRKTTWTNIEQRVKELNKLLHEYGHAYYVLDEPIVPDAVYDQFLHELIALEEQNPNLILSRFTNTTSWGKSLEGFKKVTHTISNAKSIKCF